MKKNKIAENINKLIIELENTKEEINRPLEDVVTLSVCFKVRNSITEILKLFLDSISVKYKKENSLEQLFSICKNSTKGFDNIDISKVYCNNETNTNCNDKYCQSINKVAECISVAERLNEVIINKIKTK